MASKRTDPLWYKDAIIYELHIKSFFDSNADGYGDLQGLIRKLDYLEDLGIDTIWLLPFYPSPLKDDGYDIADYESVNPIYGDEADFRQFLKEAHNRNLKVITELVVNHTSDQHPWFQTSRLAQAGSPEREFYVWSQTDQKFQDARIIFTDTETSNWSWDPVAKAFYWHRFFSHQPDLNYDNPLVLQSVISVMLKWLSMGVDGMRLDAIPYLVEREGTNCENLPETHQVLKTMRRAMDDHFADRVFLAEANQWPDDVAAYFGNGDECHMAYNFPIMPRLYMALHMEDRHPITDIMRQTPAIPDNCQWAMFLRNHDELTLEMVTDSERDYMYRAYAEHPLMRINVGIRRRLAPLLEYSRAKIQLLNSLLFSLPGTPIIYYGDEIGMGDNYYLSDRHGVRTPMQWSPDRNAGFSQAAFEQLFLPPIMDTVAGYQTVNVEQQQRDPSSLLNWMKEIIKLRRRHKVFGRGSLELLTPSNRKILAFIRKWQNETVLVVANLSRYPQAAEIPLPGFEGTAPVEMFGMSKFSSIGTAPYPLSLGPHQFYWLLLSPVPDTLLMPITTNSSAQVLPANVKSRRSISIVETKSADPWSEFTSGALKAKFEQDVLPGYIQRQRWYGGKASSIKSTRIVDWASLNTPAEHCGVFVVEVEADNGDKSLYSLYLAMADGYRAAQLIEHYSQHVVAELRRRSESLALYDALQNDHFCRLLLDSIGRQSKFSTENGALQMEATPQFHRPGPLSADYSIKRITSEQSNTSIVYGDTFILKLYRKLQAGPNPDYDIPLFLTEKMGFKNVPAVAGVLNYSTGSGGRGYVIGLLHQYFVSQGDAWSQAIEELRRFYERAQTRSHLLDKFAADKASLSTMLEPLIPTAVQNVLGIYLQDAEKLGVRVGEMHTLLGAKAEDGSFGAEDFSESEIAQFVKDTVQRANAVLDMLAKRKDDAAPQQKELIAQLCSMRPQIVQTIEDLRRCAGLIKIRCHGDLHLGQILNIFEDFVIFDFEGEPGRSIAERVRKQSPLKDVAGVIRSFSYAACASLFKCVHNSVEEFDKFLPWATACSTWSTVAFLKGYISVTAGSGMVPTEPAEFTRALRVFIIDKALYEIGYELNNRPDWLSIPVIGLIEYLRDSRR